MFKLSTNCKRGHPWKLNKKRFISTQNLYSSTKNNQSIKTVCAKSVGIFKNRIENEENWKKRSFKYHQ